MTITDFWSPAHKIVKSTRPLHARVNRLEEMLRDKDDPAAREEHRRLKEAIDTWPPGS